MSFEEGKINLTVFLLEKNPYKPKELFKEWKREEQHAAGMDFLPGLEE